MTEAELLAFDQAGLIPGPGEDASSFLARVKEVQDRFRQGEWIPESHWDWVRHHLDRLFNVKPLYICAFYSSKGLAPWQGGASWIEGRKLHSVQLRKKCWWHSAEELMAHEAVHAVRSGFDESRFEEFFAYMTSEKQWRRALGPILQRPWEAWPLMACLAVGALWPFAYLAAAVWVGLGFIRLISSHKILNAAASHLHKKISDDRQVRSVLLRLTDAEIEAFAQGQDVIEYATSQKCLRWQILRHKLGVAEKI